MFHFFQDVAPAVAAAPSIAQTTLLALVLVFGALPPIVDDWIKHRVADALLVAFYTALVGIFVGTLGLLLTQVADGATWADGGKVFAASMISGLAAAAVNYLRARAARNASGGGGAVGAGPYRTSAAAEGSARKPVAMRLREAWAGLVLAALACAVLVPAMGCGLFTPAKVADVAQIAECVLAHDDQPPEVIATICAIEDVNAIRDILSAHKEATMRDAARAKAAR